MEKEMSVSLEDKIKTISELQEGETIDSLGRRIFHKTYITAVTRFWKEESRKSSTDWIDTVVKEMEEVGYNNNERIKKMIEGMKNYQRTYYDDKEIKDRIQGLIKRLQFLDFTEIFYTEPLSKPEKFPYIVVSRVSPVSRAHLLSKRRIMTRS